MERIRNSGSSVEWLVCQGGRLLSPKTKAKIVTEQLCKALDSCARALKLSGYFQSESINWRYEEVIHQLLLTEVNKYPGTTVMPQRLIAHSGLNFLSFGMEIRSSVKNRLTSLAQSQKLSQISASGTRDYIHHTYSPHVQYGRSRPWWSQHTPHRLPPPGLLWPTKRRNTRKETSIMEYKRAHSSVQTNYCDYQRCTKVLRFWLLPHTTVYLKENVEQWKIKHKARSTIDKQKRKDFHRYCEQH